MSTRLLTIVASLTLAGTSYGQQESSKLMSPNEAARTMIAAEGFSVTVFAAEPDVLQPIGFCLDDRGRLWVAEAYNYPIHSSAGRDRILIFEDADGDGVFDKRTIFYDKLNYVTGIEVGFGGAWVMSPPYFYFIPDCDGDDVPDGEPQLLLDGFGNHANAHNLANGFSWGPDGWLYGTHGRTNWSLPGKPGIRDDERERFDGGVWRYHPLQHVWEPFSDGTTNPWGIDFDDYGQAFIPNVAPRHLYHAIQGAHYEPWRNRKSSQYAYERIGTIADHHHLPDVLRRGTTRKDRHEAASGEDHAGIVVYLGDSWPDKYRNTALMCNLHGRRINNDLLRRDGSGYTATHGPDVAAVQDPWFVGVSLRTGPDGAVFVCDWSDTGECHFVENTQRQTGRIYKISYGEAGQISNPSESNDRLEIRSTLDVAKLSDQQLVRLQLHKNDWHVRHARRNLQQRAAAGANMQGVHESLRKMFHGNPDVTRKLRALWALHVTGGADETFLIRQLDHESEYVRAWSVQLLCEGANLSPTTVNTLAGLAENEASPFVRLHLASALQRLPTQQRWAIAEALGSHAEDAEDANLPLMYWYGIEPLVKADISRAMNLLAKVKIPIIRRFMARRAAEQDGEFSLRFNELVVALREIDDPGIQLDVLDGMRLPLRGQRDLSVPVEWSAVYEKLTQSSNSDVRTAALRMGVLLGDAKAIAMMRTIVMDPAAAPDERRLALQDLVEQKDPVLPALLHRLLEGRALRAVALRGLAAYDHPDTPRLILSQYGALSADEKRDAIATLASRPSYAAALIEAVETGQVPRRDITSLAVRQLQNLNNAQVTEKLTRVWGAFRASSEDKQALKVKYRERLNPSFMTQADLSNGRVIFHQSCAACHRLFDEGGKIGPDLTAANRTNLDYVLDNVLDPSAMVSRDYQQNVVLTEDGRVVSGLIAESNDVTVTVQTPNDRIILPRDEIEAMRQTTVSMMPDDLLKELREDEVRDLVAYLASPNQVPFPRGFQPIGHEDSDHRAH